MEINITRIGNSRGIRIPASILKQTNIKDKVEVEVLGDKIILTPVKMPREGWNERFKKCGEPDKLIETPSLESDDDWKW